MTIKESFQSIQKRVTQVAQGRPVRIVAASKTVSADRLREAYNAGIRVFGENRVQEALPKIASLSDVPVEWHFIGHLQTNKVRDAVANFSWIQSISTLKLVHEVDRHAKKINKQMTLLLEINLGEEASKHGFSAGELAGALEASSALTNCHVIGLMTIPPLLDDPEQVRPYFSKLRRLISEHQPVYPQLKELSMGMSNDYVVAIEEGATIIRVGTALFGSRKVKSEL